MQMHSRLKYLVPLAVLLVSVVITTKFNQWKNDPSQRASAASTQPPTPTAVSLDVKTEDEKKPLQPISEHKRRVKGLMKSNGPDKFEEFHNNIRTRSDESGPGYKPNYQVTALLKARDLSSTRLLSKATSKVNLNWKERGPNNVSGRARAILVDPDDPTNDTWYLGSVGGGIWKTTDGGISWRNLTADLPSLATATLAMSVANTNVIYAGTGEAYGSIDFISGQGMWRSADKGETWEQIQGTANKIEFSSFSRIIIDPEDENTLVVSAIGNTRRIFSLRKLSGVYRTTDGGDTWTQTYDSGRKKVQQVIANPLNFNTQYATIKATGVIKSMDGGITWQDISTGLGDLDSRLELAIAPTDTNRIYISAVGGESGSVLFISFDAGETWQEGAEKNGKDYDWLGGQGWYDNTIAVNPFDENRVYVGGIGIFEHVIIDDGLLANGSAGEKTDATARSGTEQSLAEKISITSTPVADVYGRHGGKQKGVHPDQHAIVIIPTNDTDFRFLIANDGGMAISDDKGESFRQTGERYRQSPSSNLPPLGAPNTSQFYAVDKMNNADRYIGGTQDNGSRLSPTNPDADTDWTRLPSGDGFEASWHYDNPDMILESSQYNNIYRTVDRGNSWKRVGPEDEEGEPFLTRIAKSNQDADLVFAVGGSGVWRSDNFAESWSLIAIEDGWEFSSSSSQVEISEASPSIVWAGTRVSSKGSLFLSTDGGLTFNPVNKPDFSPLGRITGIESHPTEPSTAFMLFSFAETPKIFKTTNFGETWEELSGYGNSKTSSNGFPDVATYCLQVMPFNSDIIWVGTEIGLFESIDGGATWAYADNGFLSAAIFDMKIVNDQVIVATHGRGIWSVTLPELAGYEPLPAIIAPRLTEIKGGAGGAVNANIQLVSAFDSTFVMVENQKRATFLNTRANLDTLLSLNIPVASQVEQTFTVVSWSEGVPYKSADRMLEIFSLSAPRSSYATHFNNDDGSDFFQQGLSVTTDNDLPGKALHSAHPYATQSTFTAVLTVPIIVNSDQAILRYDDIALIETGRSGYNYPDERFFDYVIVEGSADNGITWTPLADGYDASYSSDWKNMLKSNNTVTADLYKTHTINLLDTFSAGDQILIRFRLYSDYGKTFWGWAIDNLAIQGQITNVAESNTLVPTDWSLEQNHPNPFNPVTSIRYALPKSSQVSLTVFNSRGQAIRKLVNRKTQPGGSYSVKWNGKDDAGQQVASGIYFYRLETPDFVKSNRMVLLK